MNITAYVSDQHACGPVRLEVPARAINERFPNHQVCVKSDVQISDYARSNVMVWQRCSEPDLLPKVRHAKKMGVKCVYELDDDVFQIPPEFQKPYIYYAKPEVRECIIEHMQLADAVTVSTHTLAKAVRPYIPDTPIFVVENTLDVDFWEPAYVHKCTNPTDDIVIGWMASGSHTIDAPLIVPALLRALQENERVKLLLIGWVGWEQLCQAFEPYKDRITTMDWVQLYDLPRKMMPMDIGICPLVDNAFNRSKSNLKWLQYSSLGACTLASRLDPYRAIQDGYDGILVDETREAWADAVSRVVNDDKLRHQLGVNARQTLVEKWDVRKRCGEWTAVWDMICK